MISKCFTHSSTHSKKNLIFIFHMRIDPKLYMFHCVPNKNDSINIRNNKGK